ncbi:MAG TPA: hypothetical protein VF744_08235 [Beijerinckiaceae bacterium]|jgi:hypothetical protein
MVIAGKQPDILGTYLETVQESQPVEPLLRQVRASGPAAPLSVVSSELGLGDKDFAELVQEAEREGLIQRERLEGRVTLSLTRLGLARVEARKRK